MQDTQPEPFFAGSNLLDVLSVRPAPGRGLTADYSKPGRNPVLILSDSVWRKFYHAHPEIIGRIVPIDGIPIPSSVSCRLKLSFPWRPETKSSAP